MTEPLAPFTVRPECVQCGNDRMLIKYQAAFDELAARLIVTCERCGYQWAMKPKSAS